MTMTDGRTIVAVATAEGRGGLAVVRLSGPDAVAIAREVVAGPVLDHPVESHRARLATVRWPAGSGAEDPRGDLDQVLVLPLLAPASYTGEDTVEFSCHGGAMPARLVVAACVAAGARPATAGEFTRRAFLNGRLSLDQAEAVADLIAADHAPAARAALAQLRGGLRRRIEGIERPLRELLADLEGTIEFGDEDGPARDPTAVAATLDASEAAVAALLDLAPAGRLLRDGVQVVLVGAPNAGKSSLFNALVGEERVIVDPSPGTTRDAVSAVVTWDGVRIVLHDTAGLRETTDAVEAKGMARTAAELAAADIVLWLRPVDDPTAMPLPADADALAVLTVATKTDLGDPADADLATSSLTGEGIAALRAAIVATAHQAGLEAAGAAGVMLNQRHQAQLLAVREGLASVREALPAGDEVVASLLAAVLRDLGELSGRVFTERLLDDVFGRFCVGK